MSTGPVEAAAIVDAMLAAPLWANDEPGRLQDRLIGRVEHRDEGTWNGDLRRTALPAPGGAAELADFSAEVMGRPLDRGRPPGRCGHAVLRPGGLPSSRA
jgi:hypothetical protein